MAISDYKVTESEIQANDMYNAKNQWVNEATDLKNKFDALPKKIIEKYNQLIDASLGDEGFVMKSGGTMTGALKVPQVNFSPAGAFIGSGNKASPTVLIVGTLRCTNANSGDYDLGAGGAKWNNIYANNGTIITSDENEKNTIESLDKEKATEFIKGVNPVSYKLNDGTSGRTHWGMISQDIEKLMNEKGMSSLDFAGFIKSPKTEQVKTGEDENGEPVYEDKAIEGEYTFGLRYEEFIAPMIATIQYQQQKIEEQGKQIENLTKRIEALEGEK